MSYRVRLLGELQITNEHGQLLPAPGNGGEVRTLIALCMRPGHPRTVRDLSSVTWPEVVGGPYAKLSVPISRVRKLGVPVPKAGRNQETYRTSLTRQEVDLSDFIDRVDNAGGSLSPEDADDLLGMWSIDPEQIYSFLPPEEFLPLRRARSGLIRQLASWSTQERSTLKNLGAFRLLFEEECLEIPSETVQQTKRLLIVDDDEGLTTMLVGLLAGYSTVIAHSVAEAMAIVADPSARIDGALVDLHLSARLDSQGINVIDALRVHRPEVPRVLITSSPPSDAILDYARRLGLFEVILKDGPDPAATTRKTIDRMMSDAPEHEVERARATLNTLVGRIQQVAMQAVIAARRRAVTGEGEGESLDAAADRLAEVEDASMTAVERIGSSSAPAEANRTVEEFTARFGELLTERVRTI